MIRKWLPLLMLTLIYSCVTGQNFFWSHAGVAVETNSLKDSVLAVWELDETAGTTAYDSYSDNDGTNTSATIDQTGVVSKAYDFNGTSSYVTVTSSDFKFNPLTESYSVSMWVNSTDPTPSETEAAYLITYWDGISGHPYPFRMQANHTASDQIDCVIYNGSSNTIVVIPGDSIWDGGWHLVTIVVNHSTGYFYAYCDGANLVDSTEITYSSFPEIAATTLMLSKNIGGDSRFYDGLMDQVSVWGRALTEEDLTDLYNDGSGIAYTGWQGTGAQRYSSGSTFGVTPLFTKTLNTPQIFF